MDENKLKVFLTVVEQGSLSKAAYTLNYAQSNITARIKQLERDLGKPLLYRSSKGVHPTPAGQALYEYGIKILGLWAEALSAVQKAGAAGSTLKLGAVEEIATVKLPRLLSSYGQASPDLDFDMTIGHTDQLITLLLQDKI